MVLLEKQCEGLRRAANVLRGLNTGSKNSALEGAADFIDKRRADIIAANRIDEQKAREAGVKETLIDRLTLNDSRIDAIIDGIRVVIRQKDPVGTVECGWTLENGARVLKTREPLGVAAVIYESRPNVTADVFALAYKSGNAILLRGSSSAIETNKALTAAIKEGLAAVGGITSAVELAQSGERGEVDWIMNAVNYIDVLLPRGGADLIKRVTENSRVPVIQTGAGNCHVYVDESADISMAADIAENAKMQRPGVCNALETLLVHKNIARDFLPALAHRLAPWESKNKIKGGAELRCDAESLDILSRASAPQTLIPASDEDWRTEYLDYILAIKIVSSAEEACAHINRYGTRHSEAIITRDLNAARRFQREVDAACVYVNASTRFTDGGVFGFGAELGISTQKTHVRGPMGLEALTTCKYLIDGAGQIR